MSKRLVMCCDGTWSSAGQQAVTNVVKIFHTVAPADEQGVAQHRFYQDGVGVQRWERIRGGAFGVGLSRNVRNTYRFVVENFEPGDELFFLGFSRGAYTARSTVGLVRNAGVLRRDQAHRIDEAYALYRNRTKETQPGGTESERFRRAYSHESRIRFIGVWDTVGALGIPFTGSPLTRFINRRWSFHDTTLSSTVDIACQALAIDEKRGPFEPTIWQQSESARGQRCEQVWFAGDHSDVGGGYRDTALSDIALLWMAEQVRSAGLAFTADAFARTGDADQDARNRGRFVAPDAHGQLHDARTGLFRLLPRFDRRLGVSHDRESVASSAVDRHRKDRRYAPPGLTTYLSRPNHTVTTVDSGQAGFREVVSEPPATPEPEPGPS